MSDKSAQAEGESVPADVTSAFTNLFETLVPPKSVEIENVFGTKKTVSSFISARNQIKVLREFDKIKDVIGEFDLTQSGEGLFASIISVASNENVLNTICDCFYAVNETFVVESIKEAKENGIKIKNSAEACADLFGLEEMVSAIIPLFLRMLKRATQAMGTVPR